MAKLSRIADVQISLGTLAITEKSFNDMLILSKNENLTDRVTVITGADELLDIDGITDADPIYKAAQAVFSPSTHVRQCYIGKQDVSTADEHTPETVTAALALCAEQAPAYWYGLVLESRTEQDVKDAAAWAEANERLFDTGSNDAIIITSATTDIGSFLASQNYDRSFVCFTRVADTQYPEAALMSDRFTYNPGAESWANVQLKGVQSDDLKESEYLYAKGKNVTTFENFRNFAITQTGKVASGESIDVIRLRDQLVESIKVAVVGAIVRATNSTGKLPFTDSGIAVIGNAIRSVLDLNVRRGGIAEEEMDENGNIIPSYTISLPRSSQISTNDKANRILKDVYFTARLAGAIHFTEIKGSLVYDFSAM